MYEKNNDINRRVFFIGGGMLILSSFLFSRLWNLQVTDRDKYLLLSDKNRIRITPLFPKRGIFYDRNGNELALNSTNFKLSYQSGISLTDQSIIEKIGKELRLNNDQVNNISKKILNNDFNKIEIKENLTLDEIYALNSLNMDLDSFLIEDNSKRSYLDSKSFAHLIGYTGLKDNPKSKNTKPTGLSGLELKFDHILAGHLGHVKTEVDSEEKGVRILEENKAINGQDIVLTIDRDLQNNVHKIMRNNVGAATVMNVQNGEILAMCSTPSFDSNKFIDGFSYKEWDEISKNERKPFLNKAINGEYPPGSGCR